MREGARARYEELDALCEELTESEREMGVFESTDPGKDGGR